MSPLLKGLACHLLVAGSETDAIVESVDWAKARLEQAGFNPEARIEAGEAETVIANQVARLDIDLLVMGAYGHSRIRQLIVGSTTTALLQSCTIPVLLLR